MNSIEALEALRLGKEVDYKGKDKDIWFPFTISAPVHFLVDDQVEFRIKPREMITIGDISFLAPETVKPKRGTDYYQPCEETEPMYVKHTWSNDSFDERILQRGMLHLTKENAIAHAKALIKLSGGSYEAH